MDFVKLIFYRYKQSSLSKLALNTIVICLTLAIVTLSIMNGFEKELRTKILSIIPHITITAKTELIGDDNLQAIIESVPEVNFVSKFASSNGMLFSNQKSIGVILNGIDANAEIDNKNLLLVLNKALFQALVKNEQSIAISGYQAKQLNLAIGDFIYFIGSNKQGKNISQSFNIAYIFDSKTELDKNIVFTNLAEFDTTSNQYFDGYRIFIENPARVFTTAYAINSATFNKYTIRTWRSDYGSLYTAITQSRALVAILVFIICFIAAFNLIATMIIFTANKEMDIAIFSTLGISMTMLFKIFFRLSNYIAIKGCIYGSLLGILLALFIPSIIAYTELVFNMKLLNYEIYPINYIPSQILWNQVIILNLVTIIACYISTFYPAYKACKKPAVELLNMNI